MRERTDSYQPNLNSINRQVDGDLVLKGSFNPDYRPNEQSIRDNYFNKNKKSRDGDYEPVLVQIEEGKNHFT